MTEAAGARSSDAGWQVDEAGATAYEETLVPALLAPWAEDLVAAAGPRRGQRVVDVACGTGIVARTAARVVGSAGAITGVDLNPAMLAVARRVSAGTVPEIRYEVGAADALPLPDGTADVVFCQQGLQFFPDPAAALAEFHRVGVPGGRLGVSTCRSLSHQPGYRLLVDVLARHLGQAAAVVVASPYALGELDRLHALVAGAGFTRVHARIVVSTVRVPSAEALLRGETASSPLGDVVGRLDRSAAGALVADLGAALTPHTDDDGVVFPFETAVVSANR
ncbi:methyltransferase domain-containing protein [Geodermatophilus sabuli]|uniref:Methyltransferase domain-containing protein n=1 Tax=Geodermatophilus sabuli TaxID=1564158 RepID=A0A7K3W3Q8_9ACTN|nr:methyltransferase domain-containing protein [Geodermatophilus sabuli]NEK58774.1 methyltransferase domain-containing protein [Geodermatophilus sabuli]